MYTISVGGEAAPPWVQLLHAWRRLAAAAFPPPAVCDAPAAAESQPPSDLPPLFNEFKQWAQSKGLCRYAARRSFPRFRAV